MSLESILRGIPEALIAETPSGQIKIILNIMYMKRVKIVNTKI